MEQLQSRPRWFEIFDSILSRHFPASLESINTSSECEDYKTQDSAQCNNIHKIRRSSSYQNMTFIKRERNDHRSQYHVVSAVLSKLSWAAATSLCIYFLFIYAPKHLVSRKTDIPPLLIIHLIGAYSIYLACVHNILITPRCFNGRARPFHVWIGRFGLIVGVMGFVSRVIVTWVVND